MGFKVFGVLDYDGGVDNCGEGFVGEIAACLNSGADADWEKWGNIRLLSLESRERSLDLIVLVVFVLDVVVYAVDFLRPILVKTPFLELRVKKYPGSYLLQRVYKLP